MSKELKLKNNLDKDFKQIYIGDDPTNIFINNEGEIRTSSIKNDRDGSVEISSSNKDIIFRSAQDIRVKSGSVYFHRTGTAQTEYLKIWNDNEESTIQASDSQDLVLNAGDGQVIEFKEGNYLGLRHDASTSSTKFTADANNFFEIDVGVNGATTLSTTDASTGVEGDLLIEADGQVKIDAAADHHIELGKATGFTRIEQIFSVTDVKTTGGTDDTDIDFRDSNKFRLEMTGDIAQMNLIFPAVSGNFTLVTSTNGDHDVSAWKVWESDLSAATTTDVMWAGGSLPAFTSSGVDICSFYWDATDQQCYGVCSLAFATP
tara:strand:+ start:857 stop:1810 length:954 start_codon:yes stop_codon:yes gene_type:complete